MEFSWEIVGQLAWSGLATSTFYYLFAVAFALVLKVNRVWNFGQAGIMVFAYFSMYVALRWWAVPPLAGIAFGLAVTIAVSIALEWFGFRVLRNRRSSVLTYFIFTIAISQFAIYLGEMIFGADPKTLYASIMSPVFLVGPIAISHWDLRALAVTVSLSIALAVFLRITKDGQSLSAVADNSELAEVYGIGLDRAYTISIVIAAVLVVAGMYLVGTRLPMYPATPLNQFLILAVIATILAGIGNVFAAGIAAIVLGMIQTFSILVISSRWQILIIYALIFVTILLFPSGIVLKSALATDLTRRTAEEWGCMGAAIHGSGERRARAMMQYLYIIAIFAGINVILASGFNLILGYGGLVSVAHPIFYAIGAYASALLAQKLGVPIVFAILLGALVAATTSMFVSLPSLRVSGDYLVIASMGFQLGLLHIINNVEVAGAASGLSNIPSLIDGPYRNPIFTLLIWAVALASIGLIWVLVSGPYGRAITAMRNDEDAFVALGRNAMRIKVTLFALGSGLAGLAGGLYAHFFLYLTPEQFGVFSSAALLTMVVVGGAATVAGPVLGAVLLTGLPEAIRFLDLPIAVMAPMQGVIFTLLIVLFLFLRPQGLLGGREGGLDAWSGAADTEDAPRASG